MLFYQLILNLIRHLPKYCPVTLIPCLQAIFLPHLYGIRFLKSPLYIFPFPPLPLQAAEQQPTCLRHQVCLSQQWTSFCYEVSPSPEGGLIISDKASQKISRAMQASNSFVGQIYLNLRSNWKAIPGRVQTIQTKMC